jgi:hypothetical protein
MAGQTVFALNTKPGVAGMPYDGLPPDAFVDSKPCGSVALTPGTVVELVAGVLQVAQSTGNPGANPVWGVVVWKELHEPQASGGIWLPGQEVPVMRQGRIWALLDAAVSSIVVGAAALYTHSSTTGSKGLFTTGAASGTAGSEISALAATWFKDGGLIAASPSSLAVVSLNLF